MAGRNYQSEDESVTVSEKHPEQWGGHALRVQMGRAALKKNKSASRNAEKSVLNNNKFQRTPVLTYLIIQVLNYPHDSRNSNFKSHAWEFSSLTGRTTT